MKYRHYAPTAPMLLVEGPEASLGLIRLAIMAEAHGLRTGVIALKATVDHFPKGGNFVIHNGGATLEAYAGTLFHDLRAFDSEGVDLILGEGVREDQMGLAIMNRLRKSAGHNIIWAEGGLLYHRSGAVPECLRTLSWKGCRKDERTGTWEKALNITKNKQDIPFSPVLSAGSWNTIKYGCEGMDGFLHSFFCAKSCKSDV